MSWNYPSDLVIAPRKRILARTIRRIRDMVVASALGDTGAPIAMGGWHPYGMAAAGDGGTDVVWDHAVNGSVTTITSPDFAVGYIYRFVFDGVGSATGGGDMSVAISDGSTFGSAYPIFAIPPGLLFLHGTLEFCTAWRTGSQWHVGRAAAAYFTSTTRTVVSDVPAALPSAGRIHAVRFSGATFNAGRILLERQRVYI